MSLIAREDWEWYDKGKDYGSIMDMWRQLRILRKLFDAIQRRGLERYFVEPEKRFEPIEPTLPFGGSNEP